jgi:hypothetical protein
MQYTRIDKHTKQDTSGGNTKTQKVKHTQHMSNAPFYKQQPQLHCCCFPPVPTHNANRQQKSSENKTNHSNSFIIWPTTSLRESSSLLSIFLHYTPNTYTSQNVWLMNRRDQNLQIQRGLLTKSLSCCQWEGRLCTGVTVEPRVHQQKASKIRFMCPCRHV